MAQTRCPGEKVELPALQEARSVGSGDGTADTGACLAGLANEKRFITNALACL